MLRHTKIQLDLIDDVDMLLFLERGIRGGVSYSAERYAETSRENDNETGIAYVDANNLVILL